MIFKRLGISPDPSKDQHFLTDPGLIKKMIRLSRPEAGDVIMEIGAGIGTVTDYLSKTKARVIAIEIDKTMVKALGRIKSPNLEVIYGNALDLMVDIDFNKVVSNTPYSICESLVNRLTRSEFELAVMSVPERFYRRLFSGRGDEKYSALSIKAQSFFSMSMEFRIPRESFTPVPKTDTAVILIKPLSDKDYRKNPEKYALREMFMGFRRKLKNSLMEAVIKTNREILGRNLTKNMARQAIRKMGVDESILQKRPEELGTGDLENIRKKLHLFLM